MKEIGDGEKGSGQRPEEIPMDLTVVKQEIMDWPDTEGRLAGQWVKQEVEDRPEVKDEKAGVLEVKQETDSSLVVKEAKVGDPEVKEEKVKEEVVDWSEVKEEKDNSEMKQEEKFVGQYIKEEVMHGECVKEEKDFLKKETVDDTKVKEEPPINHPVGCKRKLAMSRCETCGTEEAKYRCPRCMRYSCSLPCVKKHKAELTCNGVRDKTAYVSIQQFTEMNLLSDYRFLEDVARTADHISRDAFLKRPISNKHMYFMKNRARRQGINLKLLPSGFTKRKENSTFFDKKLKAYIRSQTGVQILMKIEYMQQNLVRYYELDPYKSLLDNLRNKVIIEYPTLHVVLKGSNNDMKVLHQVKSESTKNLGNEN
ncbi:hypothetical protein H8958_002679 [Nasalis larvatus]